MKILAGLFASMAVAVPLFTGCSNPYAFDWRIKYEVYPVTDTAPLLTFVWDDREHLESKVQWIGPIGIWEGEPATEIEMHMSYDRPQPVYAYSAGTITDISDGKQVSVRYGSAYVVRYYHLTTLAETIEEGNTVERGDSLGFTETLDGGQFWEIAVGKVLDNRERAVFLPPIDYFDEHSRLFLENVASAHGDRWTAEPDNTVGTNEATKGESWIDEVGTVRFPDDMSTYGYRFAPSYEKSIEDWIDYREEETGRDLQWLHDYIVAQWS